MSSITNVNQNSSVVNVGRTTPVSPGAQPASKSIPVVMASDQTAIPVVEQNKVQSEVALSLLGIPRAEVALGIFADVNTYDVNPTEWSMSPEFHNTGFGVQHRPTEAGALVEAPRNKVAVLTSKRFFRYQPGRVSAATFGVKSSVGVEDFSQNPVIRKFGIYDKYDGYYWETRNSGKEDNFSVVRRTQSVAQAPSTLYGVSGVTSLRGDSNSLGTLSNTQTDDYRMVGLGDGEKDATVGLYPTARKAILENRYAIIDNALDYATSVYDTYTGTSGEARANITCSPSGASFTIDNSNTFYVDLASAYNLGVGASLGDSDSDTALELTATQMEAKCKRDLDYWIDNILLDLEAGGNGHIMLNTTNFGLSNGSDATSTPANWTAGGAVGQFPNITTFEKIIHIALSRILIANKYYSAGEISAAGTSTLADYQAKIDASPATALPIGITGTEGAVNVDVSITALMAKLVTLGAASSAAFDTNTFQVQNPNGASYGNKSKLETFFDVKKNFWAYYVTIKEQTPQGFGQFVVGKVYSIVNTAGTAAQWIAVGCLVPTNNVGTDIYVGRQFLCTTAGTAGPAGTARAVIQYSAPIYGTSSSSSTGGATPADGTALSPFDGLTAVQIKDIIKNKCQRDVGYIIDGYKNDIVFGGDMETSYNMSMFLRGTGMSVYSQESADANGNPTGISEPLRHTYLKLVISNDLKAFAESDTKFNVLASQVISNFASENTKSPVSGSKGFAGNLVALRDGLIHVHAGVYDPSILKDVEQVKTLASGNVGSADDSTAAIFKLTKGSVTFGQHVRISWTNVASPETPIVELAFGTGAAKLFKGEIVKVRRVIGPKGNEFTATKEDGTLITVVSTLLDDVNFYVETVVPFIFPKDYDPSVIFSNAVTFNSEIDTTAATLTNQANIPFFGTAGSDAATLASHRAFRTVSAVNATQGAVPQGAVFPYMYAVTDDLLGDSFYTAAEGGQYLGFINTAIDPTSGGNTGVDKIRSQIDNVNFFPEYVNWVKNNVKPEYWGVYEYRVPRSRFSHDALNGVLGTAAARTPTNNGSRNRVFSDLGISKAGTNIGIARPGQNYVVTDGIAEKQESLYAFDFTKVTMLKIEFSWYGAVGALFLAYVPVGNGEARWVRVHHLRASNQLKIASLGNATLPITYTTYGGGDEYSLGDLGDVVANQIPQGYNSISHNIVKYGASYYIDGGDRGTVRLYSHNNDAPIDAKGKQFAQSGGSTYQTGVSITGTGEPTTPSLAIGSKYDNLPVGSALTVTVDGDGDVSGTGFNLDAGDLVRVNELVRNTDGTYPITPGIYKVATVSGTTGFKLTATDDTAIVTIAGSFTSEAIKQLSDAIIDPRFFMGATVKTGSALDQNLKVVWADATKVFLSAPLQSSTGVIRLLPDRSANVFGIETKKEILSTRENNAVRNRVQVYPTKLSTSNGSPDNNSVRLRFKKTPTFQSNVVPSGAFVLTADHIVSSNNLDLPFTDGATPYLLNGEETYGWFRARVGSTFTTVFGKLYKLGGAYKFESLESFNGILTLNIAGEFLPDLKFYKNGESVASSTVTTASSEQDGLSSVKITTNPVVPIPGTGTNVATIYLQKGTEQFDLSAYFDYNKEYLSFPLTDIADSLYFAVDSDTASTDLDDPISLGVTWEEQ